MSNVATISVDIDLGTQKFITNIAASKTAIKEFGAEGVSSHKALAASVKTLEGGLLGNARAAEAFLETIKGVGPLVQAAFPLLGAVAFAGVIGELGKKVFEFFEKVKEGPEKIESAFHSFYSTLNTTTDQLELTQAKLHNALAELEGKRTNHLAIALQEAIGLMDQLRAHSDTANDELKKVFKEINDNSSMFSGGGGIFKTNDVETGAKQFQNIIDAELEASRNQIKNLGSNPDPKTLNSVKASSMKQLEPWFRDRESTLQSDMSSSGGARLEKLEAAYKSATQQHDAMRLEFANNALETNIGDAQDKKHDAELTKPYRDLVTKAKAELEGLKAQLAAVGASAQDQVTAKATSAFEKQMADMRDQKQKLTLPQMKDLYDTDLTTEQTKADLEYSNQLKEGNKSLDERIESFRNLAAAIGSTFEASQKLRVETAVAKQFPQLLTPNAAEFQKAHQPDIAAFRVKATTADNAEQGGKTNETLQKIQEQIDLENALATAYKNGAEAVRQAHLEIQIADATKGKSGPDAAAIAAKMQTAYNVKRQGESEDNIAKLNDETEAQLNLNQAVWQGAEARRQMELSNKYVAMGKNGASPEEIGAQKAKDNATHAGAIADEAAKLTTNLSDQLDHLNEIHAAMEAQHPTLTQELAIRKQILETQIALANSQGQNTTQQNIGLAKLNTQQTVGQWNQINPGTIVQDFQQSMLQIPQMLGTTLADALFNHKKGDSTGKQLGEAFKGLGKQLLGEVFSQLLEKLAAEIAVHLFGIQIQTAQTTATIQNTAALLALPGLLAGGSAAGGVASGVGSAAGGVASAASSGVSAAATGLVGPLISAAGGVIGGVISGVMSLIGDNRIVKAVNGTTAAVQALGTKLGNGSGLGTSTTSTTATGTTTTGTTSGTSGILSSILGFSGIGALFGIGGSKAVDVNIVSISPIAPLSGLFHMFGFAGGTNSAPGGLSWVGEEGPELLNIPRGAQVIPNHKASGYLSGLGMSSSSHGGYVHNGDIHVHGIQDPAKIAKEVSKHLKNSSPRFSPASR